MRDNRYILYKSQYITYIYKQFEYTLFELYKNADIIVKERKVSIYLRKTMTKSKRLKRISHIIVLCMLVLEQSSPAVFANDVETTYTEIPAQEITTFPSDLAELVSTPDPITPVESPADTTETTIDTTNTIIPMPVDAT